MRSFCEKTIIYFSWRKNIIGDIMRYMNFSQFKPPKELLSELGIAPKESCLI